MSERRRTQFLNRPKTRIPTKNIHLRISWLTTVFHEGSELDMFVHVVPIQTVYIIVWYCNPNYVWSKPPFWQDWPFHQTLPWPPVNPTGTISALDSITLVLFSNLSTKTHRILYWYTQVLRDFTPPEEFHDFCSLIFRVAKFPISHPRRRPTIPHHRRTASCSLRARRLLGFQDDAARGLEILQVLGVLRLGLDPGLGETDVVFDMKTLEHAHTKIYIYIYNTISVHYSIYVFMDNPCQSRDEKWPTNHPNQLECLTASAHA